MFYSHEGTVSSSPASFSFPPCWPTCARCLSLSPSPPLMTSAGTKFSEKSTSQKRETFKPRFQLAVSIRNAAQDTDVLMPKKFTSFTFLFSFSFFHRYHDSFQRSRSQAFRHRPQLTIAIEGKRDFSPEKREAFLPYTPRCTTEWNSFNRESGHLQFFLKHEMEFTCCYTRPLGSKQKTVHVHRYNMETCDLSVPREFPKRPSNQPHFICSVASPGPSPQPVLRPACTRPPCRSG